MKAKTKEFQFIPISIVSDAYLVATGYYFPEPLMCLWGPWRNKLNAVGKN